MQRSQDTAPTDDLAYLDRFQGHLIDGERILWTGGPRALPFSLRDVLLVPLTIVFMSPFFSANHVSMYQGTKHHVVFPEGLLNPPETPSLAATLGVAMAVAFAVYIIVGRFLYVAWRRRRTFYAVTNQRVLVLTKIFMTRLRSRTMKQIYPTELAIDSLGSLRFGPGWGRSQLMEDAGLLPFEGLRTTVVFHALPKSIAERVKQLVKEQLST